MPWARNRTRLYSTPDEECKAVEFDTGPIEDFDPHFSDDRELMEQFMMDRSVAAPYFVIDGDPLCLGGLRVVSSKNSEDVDVRRIDL